jgi:hypothetical protein
LLVSPAVSQLVFFGFFLFPRSRRTALQLFQGIFGLIQHQKNGYGDKNKTKNTNDDQGTELTKVLR